MPAESLRCNAAGLALLKKHEGVRLEAYRCPAGRWTVGYGHTGPEVGPTTVMALHDAEALLQRDVERTERGVRALTQGLGLSANEFSALVCFAFNVGCGALARSRLLALLQAGDKQGAAEQFARWAYAGGKRLPGLVARREDEARLFLTPDTQEAAA